MNATRAFERVVLCSTLAIVCFLTVLNRIDISPLVVDGDPAQADVVIVLGGGGGSRLQKAVELFDRGFVEKAILVDEKKRFWDHIDKGLCDKGTFKELPLTCLVGSTSTETDAILTLAHCKEQSYDKALVVTDPYHSRRAELVFEYVYNGSAIETRVLNSGFYGNNRPPGKGWWASWGTIKTVFWEAVKIWYYKASLARH